MVISELELSLIMPSRALRTLSLLAILAISLSSFRGLVVVHAFSDNWHNPWLNSYPAPPRNRGKDGGESNKEAVLPVTFPKLAHSDAELGIVNVALAPFNADPTGRSDSTAALQAAIDYGRKSNLTIYLPLGRYVVTDTLNCTEHSNGRLMPVVMVGERGPKQSNTHLGQVARPELHLPENTTGFTNIHRPKYVVHYWEDESLPPGFHDEPAPNGSSVRTNVNYNQIFQGINIVIGSGNHGAIGIRLRGAQGSSIEDASVDLGADGFIGVVGASGSGGSHVGLTVIGGRFGLDFRLSQPAPTITGAVLINQTCSALVYSGLQTLTAVGLSIMTSPPLGAADTLGIIASVPPEKAGQQSPWLPPLSSECGMPNLPPRPQYSVPPYSGQISLVDTVIVLSSPCETCSAITTTRSIYLKNVYIRNAGCLLRMRNAKGGDDRVLNRSPGRGWTRFDEAAYAVQPPFFTKKYKAGYLPLQYESSVWVDEKKISNRTLLTNSAPDPPADIVTRHLWDEILFPGFQSTDAVSVIMPPYNAKGDAQHDDTDAIQNAIDQHDTVLLPKGYYRVSRPVQLRQKTQLIGVGRTLSYLMPVTRGVRLKGSSPSSPLPVVETFNGEGSNILAYLTIINWNHLAYMYAVNWEVYGQSHCIWRQALTLTENEWEFNHTTTRTNLTIGRPEVPLNTTLPLLVIRGGGKFYNFDNGQFNLELPSYRHLLILNSFKGVRLYQIDTEHCRGDANTEIRNSSNVEIFGMKSEGNFVIIWIRESENITLYGFGGNAAALPLTYKYPQGYAQYTPSLFRLENSRNVRLIHLVDYGRIEGGNTSSFAGEGFDPHLWSMLLNTDTNYTSPPMDRPVLYVIN